MKIFLQDGSVEHAVAMGMGDGIFRPAKDGESVSGLSPTYFCSFPTEKASERYRMESLKAVDAAPK